MWDTTESTTLHLSHDLPCLRCGHAAHVFLPCSESCDCAPTPMPGATDLVLHRAGIR